MNKLDGVIHIAKKVFVVAVHIAVAIGLTDLISVLAHNPSFEKYWPVLNVVQVAVIKGIEYYNLHKNDLPLPQ